MVSYRVGFPWYFGVLEGYARCRLCGCDLKIPTRDRATFVERVQGKKHILRDSCYNLAQGLPLVDGYDF